MSTDRQTDTQTTKSQTDTTENNTILAARVVIKRFVVYIYRELVDQLNDEAYYHIIPTCNAVSCSFVHLHTQFLYTWYYL